MAVRSEETGMCRWGCVTWCGEAAEFVKLCFCFNEENISCKETDYAFLKQ